MAMVFMIKIKGTFMMQMILNLFQIMLYVNISPYQRYESEVAMDLAVEDVYLSTDQIYLILQRLEDRE